MVYEFSKSCIVKFFLSESEKFVMIYMALLETSAEYSLVAGLVGLICRFVFQPIEETSFIMFAQQGEKLLRKWLSAILAIGTCAIIFAYMNGRVFLRIAYGDQWANFECLLML